MGERTEREKPFSCFYLSSIFVNQAVGDIQLMVSEGGIRPHAQDELINDEDDDDDDDELLTSGNVEPVEAPVAVEQVKNLVQLSDDDDDYDDDELLTSVIISPVKKCCSDRMLWRMSLYLRISTCNQI